MSGMDKSDTATPPATAEHCICSTLASPWAPTAFTRFEDAETHEYKYNHTPPGNLLHITTFFGLEC